MRKLVVLPFILVLLIGCKVNDDKLTFSEINPEKASSKVNEFITNIEINEDGTGNGIYVMNAGKEKLYLYLSQEFLEKGNSFGPFDVIEDENSLNIYLNTISDKKDESKVERKLYEVNRKQEYEFLRVYKNGEETYIQMVLVGGE